MSDSEMKPGSGSSGESVSLIIRSASGLLFLVSLPLMFSDVMLLARHEFDLTATVELIFVANAAFVFGHVMFTGHVPRYLACASESRES